MSDPDQPDPNHLNPYPEIQPRLHQTWTRGWQAGTEAASGTLEEHMPDEMYSDALQYVAWRKGFRQATSENGKP